MANRGNAAIIQDLERLYGMITDLEYEVKKINYKIADLERKIEEERKRAYETGR